MEIQPYISFVVVARNDNYGGDFTHRVNVFVKNLLTLCEKHKLLAELVIVEWNPPQDRPALKEAITWPDIQRSYCQIRNLQVPNKIHQQLPNPAGLFLFEYLGKNVGVRRARGEYILGTNPDVILNDKLIEYLASRRLSAKCFYRIDRYDVRSPVPKDLSMEGQVEYCARNVTRVAGYLYTHGNSFLSKVAPVHWRSWGGYLKHRLLHFPAVPGHVNASGDFFLMHRDWWEALRGYPELETKGKSHQIDGLIVYTAQLAGLKQVILKNPLRLYHQDHGRPESDKSCSPAVEAAYRRLREESKLSIMDDEDWGLGRIVLPESSLPMAPGRVQVEFAREVVI